MLISEIYASRQGEGLLTGVPSVFVRTSGCNLRCDFCDTPFTSWQPAGTAMSIDEIVAAIDAAAEDLVEPIDDDLEMGLATSEHVVLTGGEPLLPREVEELTERIAAAGYHITIETAGTIDRNVWCDLMSISPKLRNSTPTAGRAGEWSARHESTRYRPQIAAGLCDDRDYQLKFVVAAAGDIDEIDRFLSDFGPHEKSRVLLMPEGISTEVLADREAWVKTLCRDRGYTFCPRMHIQWYGNRRGT